MPEPTQLAFLKALSRIHESDAADLLSAIHELSPLRDVRKEARRSLLRLEQARIYPQRTPPVERTPAIQLPIENPPRFWKGYVTQSREEGEIELILCWEQGFEYNDVQMFIFMMDFWARGLKDFIIENTNKRNFEAQLQEIRKQQPNITLAECTLAEGRRLLEEALTVNEWRKVAPHKEYRHHLPTLNQLIFNAEDVGEDRGLTFINPDLEADEVAATFIGAWSLGDYGLCYDLLSFDSSIREELERDEWIERRRNWADEAKPSRFELTYVREREVSAPSIWLPFGGSGASTRKEAEAAWSLELADTPLSGTLKEMPMGTIVYKETGRHWFWTSYTLAQDQKQWRIQKMSDDGAGAQALSIEELQRRIQEHTDRVNEIMQAHNPQEPGAEQFREELIWRMVQTLYYDDALIVHLPLDRTVYGDAYTRAMGLGAIERAIVYLDRLAHRFIEQRSELLRQLGVLQEALSEHFGELDMKDRQRQFLGLAEQSLRESLSVQDSASSHITLAELLVRRGEENDLEEAETHLQKARTMTSEQREEAIIEADLAVIATQRGQFQQALQHYQRVAALAPDFEDLWLRIGILQRELKQFAEARATYEQAMAEYPQDFRPYAELAVLYMRENNLAKAREVLEQGIQAIPRSAYLLALLASIYLTGGDMRRAQATLEEAEKIDSRLDIVQAVREELNRRTRKK